MAAQENVPGAVVKVWPALLATFKALRAVAALLHAFDVTAMAVNHAARVDATVSENKSLPTMHGVTQKM